VNVAEATLAKQADLWPCGSVNIGIISKRVFWINRNQLNVPTKMVIKLAGTKLGFWILKTTAGIGNTKKRPIWLVLSTRLANPVWTFLPSGSPLSAMRSTSHREDLLVYDVTDGHGSTPQMALAVGTVFTSSPIIPCIGVHGLISLASFYLKIYPSSTHVRALETILLHFFLLALIDSAWSQVFI
jgi:hypothetical protein